MIDVVARFAIDDRELSALLTSTKRAEKAQSALLLEKVVGAMRTRAVYDEARARHPGADDVVLVNGRGEVVETTTANLLVRRDGRWWTPPLSSGGLPGVGRAALVAAGEVGEAVLRPADLVAGARESRGRRWRRTEKCSCTASCGTHPRIPRSRKARACASAAS